MVIIIDTGIRNCYQYTNIPTWSACHTGNCFGGGGGGGGGRYSRWFEEQKS